MATTSAAMPAYSQADLYRAIRKRLPQVEGGYDESTEPNSVTRELTSDVKDEYRGLTDDVRLLGALLGLIINEHEGEKFYSFIERLRQASKYAREHSGRIGVERIDKVITAALEGLDDNDQRAVLHKAVAAFRLFLLLAGIAEEYHQSEKFNQEQRGLTQAVLLAREQNLPLDELDREIEAVSTRLVITAHPTKILRQTILHHQKDIFYILQKMHAPTITELQQQDLLEELSEKIEVLWATQFSRWTKPELNDEIARSISYMTRTLYQTLPKVHHKLERAVRYHYREDDYHIRKPLLQLGSWVGGDMDGNPFVNPEVFSDALTRQHQALLALYRDDLREVLDKMSYAAHRVGTTQALQDSILRDMEEMRQARESLRNYAQLLEREPYRLKLTLMANKLDHTLRHNVTFTVDRKAHAPFVYQSPQELIDELELVIGSLRAHGYHRSVRVRMEGILSTVRIFGFHFASIDMREETDHINLAARAILEASGITPDSEMKTLTREILSPKVLSTRQWESISATLPVKEEDKFFIDRMLGMLDVARKAQKFIDPAACKNLVLTMTHRAEDVLNALLLLKTQGLFYPVYPGDTYQSRMDLVPLFETIPDLQAAADVMKTLFENEAYKVQLASRGNEQLIMLGYSDSNKDGGYFSSNWHIYETQLQLWALAKEYGIKLRFFHGRGGNLGRGGGPAQRAIYALPPETVALGQDLTEQGEVLSRYYNVPETAQARCENLLNAIIRKNMDTEKAGDISPDWVALAEQLSNYSRKKYASLVHENPDFLEYFAQVTPKEVELVKIGSRPSHRHSIKSVSDLRAIPWVFRWFQSRQIIPGWYGLGTALDTFIQEAPGNLEKLQQLYRSWPFMESVLENSELILRQTDMSIARYYCSLGKNNAAIMEIFRDIEQEYLLTLKTIAQITGKPPLSGPEVQVLKHSIELKEPYLDPLNYIQVQLLGKYRSLEAASQDDVEILERYHRVIVSSIEGIATGLGTSG